MISGFGKFHLVHSEWTENVQHNLFESSDNDDLNPTDCKLCLLKKEAGNRDTYLLRCIRYQFCYRDVD